ncbi:DUF500-domain-containing protein [Hanseniaspora valbyensis NRRL Y-1626]|uniref:DUF500-domain-containing protein n=1 Tax=Hanseniaspora valbyensis NRRL Y-1626 TaxID=766949 RepID=A0A1B7TJX9_9ASCO|nr:DUF500-domain-containing protein [Hanseniaspora valbyensis NRRL Y-1626]
MGINNPIPRSLKNETKKATNILRSFIKPNQVLGPNDLIPPQVLKNCKGLIVLTVLKGAFLFGGRVGSGVIISRLRDGSWSGPSGVILGGGSAGGQVGGELTDFVFCLMTDAAVNSFKQFGSVTLGGNLSIAAGMIGRSGEASVAANHKAASSIFSYAKTKGAFAGVSLEGSVLLERRECNRKVYGSTCTAEQILDGRVEPPEFAEPLYRLLESKAFSYDVGRARSSSSRSSWSDDYDYDSDSNFEEELDGYRRQYGDTSGSTRGNGYRRGSSARSNSEDDFDNDFERDDSARSYYKSAARRERIHNSSSKWEDDIYDREPRYSRPQSSKPNFGLSNVPQARALFTFDGEEEGDLSFRKGDTINIIKKSESSNDWWTGELNGQEGIFPANYVQMI